MENKVNDTKYFEDLIDDLIQNHNVDEDLIYLNGWSNGAMMTYRLDHSPMVIH